MQNENSSADYLAPFLLFMTIFMSMGWYFAESENELLRQELAAQSYTKPVHMKEIQHEH